MLSVRCEVHCLFLLLLCEDVLLSFRFLKVATVIYASVSCVRFCF